MALKYRDPGYYDWWGTKKSSFMGRSSPWRLSRWSVSVGTLFKLSLLFTYVYIITGKYFTYLWKPVLELWWVSVGSPLQAPCYIQTSVMPSTYYSLSGCYMGVTSTIVATNDTEFIDNNTSIYSSQETRTNKLLEGFSLCFLVIKRPLSAQTNKWCVITHTSNIFKHGPWEFLTTLNQFLLGL